MILPIKSLAFQVRPLNTIHPYEIKEHKPHSDDPPVKDNIKNPESYLSKLTYDPDGILASLPNGKHIIDRLKRANAEYHEVFNGDLTLGYNGASGPCKANWNFIQEPPTNHGKSISYIKEEQKLITQAKIDRLYEQKVIQKPSELGVVVKMVNPVMVLKKTRVENEPWENIDPVNDTRLVLAANKLNTWMEDIPGDIVTAEEHLAKISKHKFHINTDLANSFDQIWVDESKYPYLAFNSPFKGLYIMCRTVQGRKGSSETLKQLTSICFGHLEARSKVDFIHDDAHIGGQDPMQAVDNWIEFLQACRKNNIKLSPNKTVFFPNEFDVVGYTLKGQSTIPNLHRINVIKSFELPRTVGQLRTYLGLYKTFVKNQKNQATILSGLNELASNSHDKKDTIEWTDATKDKFKESQLKVDTIEPLYMPKPHDQLVITLDWAATLKGVGAVVWAIVDGSKRLVQHFSANVSEACSKKLLPCEGEALAAKLAVKAFRPLIRMSKRVSIVLTDSEPLLQAIRLLAKGHVSSSQKLNAIACNINGEKIDFQHLSGKLGLMFAADQLSRNATKCTNQDKCEICRFAKETVATCDAICLSRSTVHPETSEYVHDLCPAILKFSTSTESELPMPTFTRSFMKSEQAKDPVIQKVIWYIQSGARPRNVDNSQHNVKQFLKYAKENSHPKGFLSVANDGVLELKRNTVTGNASPQVVVPSKYYFGFVLVAHCKLNHPSQSQLAKRIKASHLILGLENIIKQVHNECLLCTALSSIPPTLETFSTTPVAKHPYEQCSGDIIRRSKQYILVITDALTQHTSTCLIKSETSEDIFNGILKAVLPFKPTALQTHIKVDAAPGLSSLIKKPEKLLKKGIILQPGRTKNKNKVAQVDRRIQELEIELRKMSPECETITENILLEATKALNDKIRSNNFSANEILFRRRFENQVEINVKDEVFASDIENSRLKNHEPSAKSQAKCTTLKTPPQVSVGQLVYLKDELSKHSVRPLYIITSLVDSQLVKVKKILHFHSKKKGRYLNIEHDVKISDLIIASPNLEKMDDHLEILTEVKNILKPKPKKKKARFNIVNPVTYSYDSSDDSDENVSDNLLARSDSQSSVENNGDLDHTEYPPETDNDNGGNETERDNAPLGTVTKQKRKSALEAQKKLRQLISREYNDVNNEVENERDEESEYNNTPIPSRDQSPDREDAFLQFEDDPPQFTYIADHTMTFSGGDPIYLGQFYDISLGSPLLRASPSDMSPEELSPVPAHSTSSRLLPIRPRGLLPLETENSPDCSEGSDSSRECSGPQLTFPTRVFYRSRSFHST